MTDSQHAEPNIPPLEEGEERLLQTVHRADGNRNDIYLIHSRAADDAATGAGEQINFVAVIRSTDEDPNDTSPPWAWQRGPTERSIYIALAEAIVNAPPMPGNSVSLDSNVEWFADRIRESAGGPSQMEVTTTRAHLYVVACDEVLTAANACLEVANRAVGARKMAAERPQHEISIQNFTKYAEEADRDFGPLYRTFDEACTAARDSAAELLGPDPDRTEMAEMVLAMGVAEDVLDKVATAKGVLGASYGPTPAAFLQGVDQANALMQSSPEDEGNIYRPPAPTQSDERTCPWCAETIKAAAVICRFCGRDVENHPDAG